MVVNTIFVCHSVDPDLEVDIFFEKEGKQKKGALVLKEGIEVLLNTCIGG